MSDYLDSLKGQIHQFNKRKYRKILLSIDAIPRSKNSIKEFEEKNFQQNILEYLKKSRRRAYRSPVVVEIDFYSFQNDPPAIHTLAKCYIDLLENNKIIENNKRKKLLYCNDRQVKVLFVNYHLGFHEKNEIHIKIDSFSNFLNDIILYGIIYSDDFEEIDCSNLLSEYRSEKRLFTTSRDAIEKYVEFMKTSEHFRSNFGEIIYESLVSIYKKEAQKEYLQNIELDIKTLVLLFQKNKILNDRRLQNLVSSIFLKPYFSINLGRIPEKKGDNECFKTVVKERLLKFMNAKQEWLFPLCAQLCVTIILFQSKNSGIDLDNLARKIIPFVNEILQPPIGLITKDEIDKITNAEIKEKLNNDYERRKRMPKHSITRYQIFEVPSMHLDDEGRVLLFLGDGSNGTNIWDQVESLIEEWYKYVT